MNRIETIAIGDELLTGRISDTNSTFISDELFKMGMRLQRISVIPDDFPVIESQIRESAKRAELVICFGGLGPTSDDKTAEAVSKVIGGGVSEHEASKERLLKFYEARGREVTSQALKQILYPTNAEPLLNTAGMAPGFHCRIEKCDFYFLPGVPREMKTIFFEHIKPRLIADAAEIETRIFRCIGIWESELQKRMDAVEATLPKDAWLGYRTRFPENHLTLYGRKELGAQFFDETGGIIREILKPWTYTESHRELEELIFERLKETAQTLAFAESCTGGLAAQRMTRVSGASDVIWGGVTVYQSGAKAKLLDVVLANPLDAVSAETSRKLAENLKKKSGCSVAAAVTGYLGPAGGTDVAPLGTIYLAVLGRTLIEKKMELPNRPREEGQWGASTYLLHLIYEAIR